MTETDRKPFAQILSGLFETFEMQLSPTVVAVWWGVLERFSLADVRAACGQYAATGTNRPRPAHIREILIAATDPWPSAEEAWSYAPKSEAEGAYVFQEQMQALNLVQDAIDRGDLIAARADFKPAYTRLVDAARDAGRAPKFWYSAAAGLPWEQADQARAAAIVDARNRGWLTNEQATDAAKRLQSPAGQQIANTSIAGLEGPGNPLPLITQLTRRLSVQKSTSAETGNAA